MKVFQLQAAQAFCRQIFTRPSQFGWDSVTGNYGAEVSADSDHNEP